MKQILIIESENLLNLLNLLTTKKRPSLCGTSVWLPVVPPNLGACSQTKTRLWKRVRESSQPHSCEHGLATMPCALITVASPARTTCYRTIPVQLSADGSWAHSVSALVPDSHLAPALCNPALIRTLPAHSL